MVLIQNLKINLEIIMKSDVTAESKTMFSVL